MSQLDGRTLMMAIRAIALAIAELERALASATGDQREPLIEQLVRYDEAADALRVAYRHECDLGRRQLPAYEGLLHGSDPRR